MKILGKMTILSLLMILLAAVPMIMVPTALGQSSPTTMKGHEPTYVGSPSKWLKGPYKSMPVAMTKSTKPYKPTLSMGKRQVPLHTKPGISARKASSTPSPSFVTLPTITCSPTPAAGCDTPTTSLLSGTKTVPIALNTIDGGYGDSLVGGGAPADTEPPDQGLCAGAGYVMEVVNGAGSSPLRVWSSNFNTESADIPLDSLMGLTTLGWSSGGDPTCLYDYDNGGHWFITQIVSTNPESAGGAITGCFTGAPDGCMQGIAVSVSSDPLGAYNVYFLDPNFVNTDPGSCLATSPFNTCSLLDDFAKMGNTRDALLLFYDEFQLLCPPTCPTGYGQFGFNGAQQFAFSKKALELGFSSASPYLVAAYENMGLDPAVQPPDGNCFTNGITCWLAQIPAQSPDPTQFENSFNGVGWMMGSLDFFGNGDNRIAVWYWQTSHV